MHSISCLPVVVCLSFSALLGACTPKAPDSGAAPASNAPAPGSQAAAKQDLPPAVPVPEDVASVPESAQKSASGLASRVLKPGTGSAHPAAEDTVQVHYTGWTTDGAMFDSSVQRGQPASFPLNGVIPGWTEGLQLMTEGQSMRLWIPANLAYGNQAGRPQGMLVFDVELLSIR